MKIKELSPMNFIAFCFFYFYLKKIFFIYSKKINDILINSEFKLNIFKKYHRSCINKFKKLFNKVTLFDVDYSEIIINPLISSNISLYEKFHDVDTNFLSYYNALIENLTYKLDINFTFFSFFFKVFAFLIHKIA